MDESAHARVRRCHGRKREGHELEPGADQPQFGAAPGLGKKRLKTGDKVIFEGYAGKVVESRGSLLSIAKVEISGPPAIRSGGTAGEELSASMQNAKSRIQKRGATELRYSFARRPRCLLVAVFCVAVGGEAVLARASQQSSDDLDVVPVRPDFYMIAGAGGNVAVQIGPAGVILVDTGSAPMADAVLAAIRRLTNRPIRYIINTSADADHVGGNEKLSKAGQTILGHQGSSGVSEDVYTSGGAACVLAHENVFSRMSAPGFFLSLWGAADKNLYGTQLPDVPQRRRDPGRAHARRALGRRQHRLLQARRCDCERRHRRHDPLSCDRCGEGWQHPGGDRRPESPPGDDDSAVSPEVA